MTDKDIVFITRAVDQFCEGELKVQKGFCAAVSTEEIAERDYIRAPGHYAGIPDQEDDGEPFGEKMARLEAIGWEV
jgi:type I restriction enzyme M protein